MSAPAFETPARAPSPVPAAPVLPWLLSGLAAAALALPFLWARLQLPITNFWPGMVAWACGALLVLMAWAVAPHTGALRARAARVAAAGLLLAAVLGAGVGLVQYFVGDPGWRPWVYPSVPGEAMGNLRQRNQQATLLALGAWSLLWWAAHLRHSVQPGHTAAERWVALPLAWTLLWLAIGAAATTSRTGALQWALLGGVAWAWWGRRLPLVRWMVLTGGVIFVVAAWVLPLLLYRLAGVEVAGLFGRLWSEPQACVTRSVLWPNMLELIALKPWTGWGWGGLSYAHYAADYRGMRFCLLLDNAHNLPLHLAVELGLPLAVLVCSAALLWVWQARPWAEGNPARQWAWGVLGLIGLHSMLEFPLWYGPFQIAALVALALLWRRPRWWPHGAGRRWVPVLLVVFALGWAAVAWDFSRVRQLYLPVEARHPDYREQTFEKVAGTWLFPYQVDFAVLSITRHTPENAEHVFELASGLLRFSPEPRVIEAVIQSATWLGRTDDAAWHCRKYRDAYPEDFARWQARLALQPGPVPCR